MLRATNVPEGAPTWIADFLSALEDRALEMLDKSKNADDALRAAGAYQLLKYAGAELDIAVARQENVSRALNAKLNAR